MNEESFFFLVELTTTRVRGQRCELEGVGRIPGLDRVGVERPVLSADCQKSHRGEMHYAKGYSELVMPWFRSEPV